MTQPNAGERRAAAAVARGEFIAGPVQPEVPRVKSGMNQPIEAGDEERTVEGAPASLDPTASEGPGVERFGGEAVPLRSTAERDAAAEREERLGLVAAGSRRRSPLRSRRSALGIAVVIVGFVVLAVDQVTGGSTTNRIQKPAEYPDPKAGSRTRSSDPSLAVARAISGRRPRSHRTEVKRRIVEQRRHERRQHLNRRGRTRRRAPENTPRDAAVEPAPKPEAELVPAATPVSEPPSPPPASEPAMPRHSQASEQSEVEAQFGFEK